MLAILCKNLDYKPQSINPQNYHFYIEIMTLPARLLWGVKLHENVIHVMHFDVCFDKSCYRKLSFSYRNNHIIAVRLLCG